MPAGEPAAGAWPCLAWRDGLSWLDLVVSPNARRTQADALHDAALRVRLAAPPVDGKANSLLLEWLAGELGLPRRAVRLARGESSRRKQIAIDAPPGEVAQWLARCLGPR